MFFATPVVRRASFVAPGSADFALQRFLQDTLNPAGSAPQVQVSQDEQATRLTLDVPGLARDQLELQIEGPVVRLASVEGAPRQVQRAWKLEHDIDAAARQARLENGELSLTLARLAPESRAVKLAIE